jgi:hypothetical protein
MAHILSHNQLNRYPPLTSTHGFKVDWSDRHQSFASFLKPLALSVFLMFVAPVSATTIVAVRSSTEVVLAADSKSVDLQTGSGGSDCKIFACGRYFVGVGGIYRASRGPISFDAFALVKQACSIGSNAEETADRIAKALVPPYAKFLEDVRQYDTITYESGFLNKVLFLNLVLVGFENGQSFILGRDVIPPSPSAFPFILNIGKHDLTDPLSEFQGQTYFLGSHDGIDGFISTHPAIRSLGVVEAARFFVAYEIADEPNRVGPPIDIVTIDKTAPHWIQRKPDCEDQKKAIPPKPRPH